LPLADNYRNVFAIDDSYLELGLGDLLLLQSSIPRLLSKELVFGGLRQKDDDMLRLQFLTQFHRSHERLDGLRLVVDPEDPFDLRDVLVLQVQRPGAQVANDEVIPFAILGMARIAPGPCSWRA
jgi:hypothetical protein